ncbi:Low molecular weight protein-tyrosine-phosphatase YfkJ [compost metagenome]
MDSKNLADVSALIKKAKGEEALRNIPRQQLFTFMELLPDKGIKDVPDPYYDGNFNFVYELVENGCRELLKRIQSDLNI